MAHKSVNLGLEAANKVKELYPKHSYTEAITLLLEQNKLLIQTLEDLLQKKIKIGEAKGRVDFILMQKDCGK